MYKKRKIQRRKTQKMKCSICGRNSDDQIGVQMRTGDGNIAFVCEECARSIAKAMAYLDVHIGGSESNGERPS